ncbi:hypothetical protein [Halobacterium litoreum]|uniref:Uncharacterized protein n=1 Tax=Halobacterium litoreum TaxID=2039234 RepID=A0ABD5NF25_9EURY|nr:hypothetical protein [Halobacterium litoreum]UHH13428.1 hypothetical protein LT972_00170 [Halobacterium litoreum]
MPTSYLSAMALCGVVGAALVSAAVERDARGRRLPGPSRWLLVAVACFAGFGAFLVPVVYERQLSHFYFHVVKPAPTVVSPYEWLTVSVATGALLCEGAYATYVAGVSRVAPAEGDL